MAIGANVFAAGAPSTATAPAGAVGIAVRSGCSIGVESVIARSVDRLVPRWAATCVPLARGSGLRRRRDFRGHGGTIDAPGRNGGVRHDRSRDRQDRVRDGVGHRARHGASGFDDRRGRLRDGLHDRTSGVRDDPRGLGDGTRDRPGRRGDGLDGRARSVRNAVDGVGGGAGALDDGLGGVRESVGGGPGGRGDRRGGVGNGVGGGAGRSR